MLHFKRANNCCSVMHILVPLEATFLNINNNKQSPLQRCRDEQGALEGGPWLVLLDVAKAPAEGTGPWILVEVSLSEAQGALASGMGVDYQCVKRNSLELLLTRTRWYFFWKKCETVEWKASTRNNWHEEAQRDRDSVPRWGCRCAICGVFCLLAVELQWQPWVGLGYSEAAASKRWPLVGAPSLRPENLSGWVSFSRSWDVIMDVHDMVALTLLCKHSTF